MSKITAEDCPTDDICSELLRKMKEATEAVIAQIAQLTYDMDIDFDEVDFTDEIKKIENIESLTYKRMVRPEDWQPVKFDI